MCLGLYVYDFTQKKRTLLRPAFSRLKFAGMRWMPDNRRLITFQTLAKSPKARYQAAVVDTLNATVKNLVVLQVNDFEELDARIDTQPQFQPLEVSDNGKLLFVEVSEFVGRDESELIDEKSLQAVNLDTGEVEAVAKVRSTYGMDWYPANGKTPVSAKR